jgi:hypothetical protein
VRNSAGCGPYVVGTDTERQFSPVRSDVFPAHSAITCAIHPTPGTAYLLTVSSSRSYLPPLIPKLSGFSFIMRSNCARSSSRIRAGSSGRKKSTMKSTRGSLVRFHAVCGFVGSKTSSSPSLHLMVSSLTLKPMSPSGTLRPK